MKDLDSLILDSPNGSEEKKEDPKKMGQNHTICKNLVNHFLGLTPDHSLGALFTLTNLYRGGRSSFLFGHLEQHDRRNDSDAP